MHRSAVRHLKAADPVLAKLISRVGPCRLRPNDEGSHFEHVARAIVYQQLSGKAAATIYGRVKELFGKRGVTPKAVLATPDEKLRAAGLSGQKLSYIKDLATKVANGEVPIETLHQFDDPAIIEALTTVKGVGVWTAQMFLMFRLGRPDVLPLNDLGIQKAIMYAYGLKKMPDPKQVLARGASWAPYRTVACWYLWRSLD